MRRDFQLPNEDVQFLNGLGLSWEAIIQGSERWVLIHEHALPTGYNHGVMTLAILISGGYPEAPLDMFFVHPLICRSDGVAIPAADVQQAIDGKTFQRWSRHRPGEHPWRAGVDNLETHAVLIRDALADEFIKRPRA